jgi:hypothetical protein
MNSQVVCCEVGRPCLRDLDEDKTGPSIDEAREMACLHGQETGLIVVCIGQVVHQVRTHRPHPEQDEQRSAGRYGPQAQKTPA